MTIAEALSLLLTLLVGAHFTLPQGRHAGVLLGCAILLVVLAGWPALFLGVDPDSAWLADDGPVNLAVPSVRFLYWPLTCGLTVALGLFAALIISYAWQQTKAAGQAQMVAVLLAGAVILALFAALAALGVSLGQIGVVRALLLVAFCTAALIALFMTISALETEAVELRSSWGGLGGGLGGWRISRPLALLGCAGAFAIAAALAGVPGPAPAKPAAGADPAGPYKLTVQLEPRGGETQAAKPPAVSEPSGARK